MNGLKHWVHAGLAAFVLAAGIGTVQAASTDRHPTTVKPLDITISQGKLVSLPGPAASVFVADPAIANVQVPLPNKVFVFGVKAGRTTVYALGADGTQLASFLVVVHNDTTAVEQSLSLTPDAGGVNATSTDSGVTLRGLLPTPDVAATTADSASAAISSDQKLEDETRIKDSAQVMLQVRFAEVSRTVTKDLGLNLDARDIQGGFSFGAVSGRQTFTTSAPVLFNIPANGDYSLISTFTGKNFSMENVLDLLAQEGLVTVLAEPDLITVSGQPASFLAGGQFPIPLQQNTGGTSSISVQFQQYGVSLDFVPTVYDSSHISLKVRPEVSELTNAGAVTINGLVIPALTVRRADTTVELGSGESFAIGGLLENTSNTTLSKYPGLGDLPILGPLFRSSNFQRSESELVIIVTPYIVRPIDDPSKIHLPTDGLRPASDIERLFYNRVTARPNVPPPDGVTGEPGLSTPRLVGDAGFDVQ